MTGAKFALGGEHRRQAAGGTIAPALLWVGVAVLLVAPLIVTPIVPLIDFYNHVARFYVLSHLDDPFLAQNYTANWQLLPNIGLDVPATWLAAWLEPLLLAKLLIVAIIALQFGGALFLQRALTGRTSPWSILLAASLCYSFILSWGFVNYLLAAAVALWTLGLWVRLRERPWRAAAACAPLALIILFCHGFAFGLYGIVAGALEFGLWWRGQDRRWPNLVRGWAALAVQAIVPALCFLAMPTAEARTYAAPLGDRVVAFYQHGTLAERLWRQTGLRVEAVVRVAETPWPLVDLALFAATAALLITALRRRTIAIAPAALPALALVTVLVVVTPAGMFGAGHLFERMPLLLALLFAAALHEPTQRSPSGNTLLAALAGLTALRFVVLAVGWSAYAGQYQDFRKVTAALPDRQVLAGVLFLGDNRRDGLNPRCQMLTSLAVLEKRAATPLFADRTQQPITLKGDVAAVARSIHVDRNDPAGTGLRPITTADDEAQLTRIAADRIADAVLVCGRERFRGRLPANLEPIGAAGVIDLYAIR